MDCMVDNFTSMLNSVNVIVVLWSWGECLCFYKLNAELFMGISLSFYNLFLNASEGADGRPERQEIMQTKWSVFTFGASR